MIAERPGVRMVPLLRYPYHLFYRTTDTHWRCSTFSMVQGCHRTRASRDAAPQPLTLSTASILSESRHLTPCPRAGD